MRLNISFAALLSGILLLIIFASGCAHPNAALGEFRGKYVRAGFMTNDSSLQTEIVLTSRGEIFSLAPQETSFVKKEKLSGIKTKALMLAVEKSGILQEHENSKGMFATFYVEYHKRKKVYRWTWGEFQWPEEVTDLYKDFEKLRTDEDQP